jgi:hypothetical protein
LENLGSPDVRRRHDAVVHPFTLPPCSHDPGAAQVGKVSGDLWLGLIEDFDKVADANLLIAHQIQEPEAGIVTESLKEAFGVEGFFSCCHKYNYIRIDGCVQREYSRFGEYIRRNHDRTVA